MAKDDKRHLYDTPQARIYNKGIDDLTVEILERHIVSTAVSLEVPFKCACTKDYTCTACLRKQAHFESMRIPVYRTTKTN